MQYIHIKNIEEYNPGYKDRAHIWAKVYWKIFIDEDYQSLSEIDRHRLIGLIVFETYNQKPVALTPVNVALMGWDTKKQPIPLTLKMLHKFIEDRSENVTQSRVEKSRVEKSRVEGASVTPHPSDEDFIKDLERTYDYANVPLEIKKMEQWLSLRPGRKLTRRFIVNWLNKIDKPLKPVSVPIKNKTIDKAKEWEKEEKVDPKDIKKLLKDTISKMETK